MNTNTTDRELLELAAKAVGIKGRWFDQVTTAVRRSPDGVITTKKGSGFLSADYATLWRPLVDAGQRYELAKTLNMNIEFDTKSVGAKLPNGNWMWIGWGESSSDGRHKTDADAILALAAEIGRLMP